MVTKKELEDEVQELREQLAESIDPDADTGKQDAAKGETKTGGHGPAGLLDAETVEQFKAFAEAQGFAADELKGLWTQLVGEMKDMPQKKPMVTALAAFMLGFSLGRMSRR